VSEMKAGYEIKICHRDELPLLLDFIEEHWRANHPLVVNRELMDWQHYNPLTNSYNFIIAYHRQSGQVHGMLGFIPTSQFDHDIEQVDIWLAIWKVREELQGTGVGLEMLRYLEKELKPRSVSGFGLSRQVIPIYRHLGFTVGQLNHYYLLNRDRSVFELVGNFDGQWQHQRTVTAERSFIHYGLAAFLEAEPQLEQLLHPSLPAKSLHYLRRRYLEHPAYRYHLYGLQSGDAVRGIIVLRQADHAGSSALRWVDYYGDISALAGTASEFQRLLLEYDAEYIDFYNLGLEPEQLAVAGFLQRTPASGIVIPNYFEPFEQRNIELDYTCKAPDVNRFSMCRGDADQDRPNQMPATGV
jgi:GNAT superfamily N-acetyltransferase